MKKFITLIVLKLIFLSNINAQVMSVYDDLHEYISDQIAFEMTFELLSGQHDNYFESLEEINQKSIAQQLKVPISEYENYNIYQIEYGNFFLLLKNNILEKIIYPIKWSYDKYIYLSRNLFDVIFEDNYYVMLQWKEENIYSNIGLIKIYKYYYINNSFDEYLNSAVLCIYRK
jgi:hypothetical protein